MSHVDTYTNYFKNIAVKHKDLLHNIASEDGDVTPGEKAFTSWSVEESVSGLRTKISNRCLLLELFEELLTSEQLYEIRGNYSGAFTVIFKSPTKKFSDELDMFSKAYTVIKQILKKIWLDMYKAGNNFCGKPFKEFDFNGLRLQPVSNILDGTYFGYRCEFTFSFSEDDDITSPLEEGTFID